MRLGILAKGGTAWIGGLYYTFNLVRALRNLPQDEQPEIDLLVPAESPRAMYEEVSHLVELLVLPPGDGAPEPLASPRHPLTRLMIEKRIDILFPCLRSLGRDFPIGWLPWAYDLQHRRMPELFSAAERSRRDRAFAQMAEDAPCVIVSSDAARRDFSACFQSAVAVTTLHFRSVMRPHWLTPDPVRTCAELALPRHFFLVANQFWKHKNHQIVFEAMAKLAVRGIDAQLVCTGQTDDPRSPEYFESLQELIVAHGIDARVRILGLVPRAQQVQLLRSATAVVQPSLFEGWSTVVEDARALGKRLILSDIDVHREQAPPQAEYFDPHDAEALADAMAHVVMTERNGFDREGEAAAQLAQKPLIDAYARQFLAIAGEFAPRCAASHRIRRSGGMTPYAPGVMLHE